MKMSFPFDVFNSGDWNPFSPREEQGSFRSDQRPQWKRPPINKKKALLIALVVAAGLILSGVLMASEFFVDLWWYQSEGLSSVFWRQILPQWGLMALAAVIVTLYLGLMATLTRRDALAEPQHRGLPLHLGHPLLLWGIALALGLFVGNGLRSHWIDAWQFAKGGAFGSADPLFGHDIGFYVFRLPFLNTLRHTAFLTVLLGLLISCGILALSVSQVIRLTDQKPEPSKRLLRLPLIQGALLSLLWGAGYWLKRYDLLYSPRGVGWGASYTDVHVLIPASYAMTAVSVIIALALIWAIYRQPKLKVFGTAALILGLLGWGLNTLAPGLVQKYIVDPNEFRLEEPYITYNIASTLKAFKLDQIKEQAVEPESMITPADAESDRDTLDNVRLWDFRALLRSYKQLQEIRTYYNFSSVDTDRYKINGTQKQVMLALRELDPRGLQNPSWVNSHLEFTHGYGLVMNGAGEMGTNGQPNLWFRDLPPVSSVNIKVDQPKIYFGEGTENYVFVKTKVKEFDYPLGGNNARSSYDGTGGAPINSLWKRLIYSLAFKDSKILFSDVFTDESRVLWRRDVMTRLKAAAPFLHFDSDPYPAVVDGHILWIADGYTLTDRYPYSQPMPLVTFPTTSLDDPARLKGATVQPVNYIRNTVKAVVDAYDGHVSLYLIDDQEPLAACWNRIFPGLFKPASQMSADLKAHLRYPEDLFRIQARAYRSYHMTDPNTFYNREDTWETMATDHQGFIGGPLWKEEPVDMDTYYVTLKLQGEEDKAEFMMMTPYTPTGRDNMIAWMAGRSDGDKYGELIVKRFSKRTLIYGPNQVSALINQTPDISAQLSLWTQRGSDVVMGHLLVVPVGNSLLYVQPLYLKASRSDLPELKRVIVSSGGQVAWGETFDEALANLMSRSPLKTTAPQEKAGEAQPLAPGSLTEQDKVLLEAVRRAFNEGNDALKQGDWATWGRKMDELERLLGEKTDELSTAPLPPKGR